jgi:hypothetical protein
MTEREREREKRYGEARDTRVGSLREVVKTMRRSE